MDEQQGTNNAIKDKPKQRQSLCGAKRAWAKGCCNVPEPPVILLSLEQLDPVKETAEHIHCVLDLGGLGVLLLCKAMTPFAPALLIGHNGSAQALRREEEIQKIRWCSARH